MTSPVKEDGASHLIAREPGVSRVPLEHPSVALSSLRQIREDSCQTVQRVGALHMRGCWTTLAVRRNCIRHSASVYFFIITHVGKELEVLSRCNN